MKELKLHDRRGKLEAERWNDGKVWVHFTGALVRSWLFLILDLGAFFVWYFGWELDQFLLRRIKSSIERSSIEIDF